VQVVSQPSVSIAANNDVICIGGTSTITATTTNCSGSFAYQSQTSPNGSTWSNTGTNSSTYIVNGTVAGTFYYRVIVNDLSNGCNDPVSAAITVIVQSSPTVTLAADQDSVCVFGAVELTPSILNGSGLYEYQWQSSTAGAGGPWTSIPGANSPTYN